MATLSLTRRGAIFDHTLAAAAPLIDWLRGGWGLLFSHPDDFANWELEADRWMTLVQDAFVQAQARPLAIGSSGARHDGSWIAQIEDGRDSLLVLETPRHLRSDQLEANSSDLRRAICRAPSRFVMAIDQSLRVRRTFGYAQRTGLPSLLDLAATVSKLRKDAQRGDDAFTSAGAPAGWLVREASTFERARRLRQARACA